MFENFGQNSPELNEKKNLWTVAPVLDENKMSFVLVTGKLYQFLHKKKGYNLTLKIFFFEL